MVGNQKLSIYESLDAMHMHMFQRMREVSSTPKQKSVFCLDMARKQRGTGYSTQFEGRCYIAVMSSLMKMRSKGKYDDEEHKLILDFSSNCESEAQSDNQAPGQSAPKPLRRSTRERYQPNYYGMEQSHLSELQN